MGMFSDIDYSLIVLQLEKAMANGVATLDSNTKVPKAQISLTASDVGAIASTGNEVLTSLNAASGTISSGLLPAYVDDVLNYTNLAGFPGTGETGKIYVAEDSNKVYRWSGSVYVEISSSATAGEALKLTTPRTIATTGDASYSVSFDGSANVTSAITLATVNSNAGSFGSASSIPAITVNAKGQVTAVSTNSIGNELIALQSLSDTPGFLKKTGNGTYSIDVSNYLSLAGGTITGDLVSTSATASTSPTTGAIRGASMGITGNASIGGNVICSKIGAGETNPATKMHGRADGDSLQIVAFIQNRNSGANAGCAIAFSNSLNPLEDSRYSFIGAVTSGAEQNGNHLVFATNPFGTYAIERMRITASGRIGVGTSSPNEAFHVNGNIITGGLISTSATPSTSPTTGASRVTGGQGVQGDQYVGGFSSLGGDANHPGIKIKVLTGTTAATEGGVASIAHGLTVSKIVSVTVLVNHSENAFVLSGYSTQFVGLHFSVSLSIANIQIINHPTDSENILLKPVKITVIYTE
jgi:hypothetical protein